MYIQVTLIPQPLLPLKGEGEPDQKSLARSGRGLSACGIQEKGEGELQHI